MKIIKSYFENLIFQVKKEIKKSDNIEKLKLIDVKYFGKNGYFSKEISCLKNLSKPDKKKFGKILNQEKKTIQELLKKKKNVLEKKIIKNKLIAEKIDISLPGRDKNLGNLHPLSHTILLIEKFFSSLGFLTVSGQEIEDSYHNFDALNISIYHPSRTNHDTFWIDSNRLLRTQTSGIQIRIMKSNKPPIRILSSGKVYRNDCDQNHTPMFHQSEGFIVDTDISFANLKKIIYDFLKFFFKKKLKIRFRPSYFPFTEPSAEVDIMDKNGSWLEILGCGMIHPNVFHNVGIDSELYSGFAFGIGIERLTMLRYGITDARTFFENDIRFLKQFK